MPCHYVGKPFAWFGGVFTYEHCESPYYHLRALGEYFKICHVVCHMSNANSYKWDRWIGIPVLVCILLWTAYVIRRVRSRCHSPIGNSIVSQLVEFSRRFCAQPFCGVTVRSMFMSTPQVSNRYARNHTHPESAKARNDSASFMELFALRIGKGAYFVQESAADVRRGRRGCRTFHWSKDANVAFQDFDPDDNDILCIVDVDMYLDMPSLLSSNLKPVVLSTFQPRAVADVAPEYSFTFDDKSEVIYKVSGGATYHHPVWNYGLDTTCAITRKWLIFEEVVTYNVDRRQLAKHHQIVLLTPVSRFILPFGIARMCLQAPRLKRLNVIERCEDENFLRMEVRDQSGVVKSTGKPGMYLSANIPAVDDDTLSIMSSLGRTALAPAQVKQVLDTVEQGAASLLTSYHRKASPRQSDVVYPVADSIFRYQDSVKEYDPDARNPLIPFMSPLVPGCFSPDRCLNNDKAAVRGRVEEVRARDIQLTPRMTEFIAEFSELLIPEPHLHHPVDQDELYQRQCRPSQKAILDKAGEMSAVSVDKPCSTFQKAEAYGKVTDPRIITTIPGVNKRNYSRYVYSFTEAMRATDWYAFGKTPATISERVTRLCQRATKIVCTDLSRFDGRVSVVHRTLEHVCMLRWFAQDYAEELDELMASQQNQQAYTEHGYKYDTLLIRLSGSPETADFNSLDNAFMDFVTKRRMGLSPQDAWQSLGIYGGDDGLSADSKPDTYVSVCAEMGQVLEIDEFSRGQVGVNFLARFYGPNVWWGCQDSICDVKRQLAKFHVTVSLPPTITPMHKFGEKALSFLYTDFNTPIIGDIARMFTTTFPEFVPSKLNSGPLAGVGYAHSIHGSEDQYPNEPGDWMWPLVQQSMPTFDVGLFKSWIMHVMRTRQGALSPPVCIAEDFDHGAKKEVVVNGVVVAGKPPPPAVAVPKGAPAVVKEKKIDKDGPLSAEELKVIRAELPCRDFCSPAGCKRIRCRYKH